MTDKIPAIYASIGDREDIDVTPNARSAVAAVLTASDTYSGPLDPDRQIAELEQAVREALSPQFLADSLREWADKNLPFPNAKAEVEKLANMISPRSM